MKFVDAINRILAPIRRQISLIVGRGVVKLTTDATAIQVLQASLLKGEVRDRIERFQEYGFTSRPKAGAEIIVVFPGGDRSNGIVVACEDRRYRLKSLADGEVAIYTDEGDKIHLKRGREIEITTAKLKVNASTSVEVNSPEANINAADVTVTADNATMEVSGMAEINAPLVNIAAATAINADTPLLNVTGMVSCAGIAAGGAPPVAGNAVVSGQVSDGTGSMADMRSIYNSHTHPETGMGGGTTNPPNQGM